MRNGEFVGGFFYSVRSTTNNGDSGPLIRP